jgi:tetratricopeptide (TPR) repeat protein
MTSDVDSALKAAAEHYNAVPTRFQEVYDTLLPFKDLKDNCEVQWQLARASRDVAQLDATVEARKKELIYEAYQFAQNAMAADADNFASHKWIGITTNDISKYEGTKKTIENAFIIRDAFKRATELNPTDATSWFLLGEWCYNVANLGWVQRKAAAAFFAAPPTSTYEEAIQHFKKAEEVKPLFYIGNQVSMARAYLGLKNKAEAKKCLQTALTIQPENEKDEKLLKEAQDLLKTL